MGILTGDDNIVDAALSEILGLPIEHRHSVDPQRNVDYLLIQHHLSQVSRSIIICCLHFGEHRFHSASLIYSFFFPYISQTDAKMAVSVAQRAVYAEPSNLEQRNRLATLIVRDGRNEDGCALLADTEGTLSSVAGSSALNRVGDIQALTDALLIQSVALASQATLTTSDEETSTTLLGKAQGKAQRAILLRPWELKGWQTLAYVRSRMG